MQCLADIIRRALETGLLSVKDLYSTESEVIDKLKTHAESSAAWDAFTNISAVALSADKLPDRYCVKVNSKRRYIDPLTLTETGVKRISAADANVKAHIDSFLKLDFSCWLSAK